MSDIKSVNGYLIKEVTPGAWWVLDAAQAQVAGAFASETSAMEVAAVLQDQPDAPARKRKNKI